MSHHWLIITFSWFGSVSLQYINTGGPGSDVGFDVMEGHQYSLPSPSYNTPQLKNDFRGLQMDPLSEQFFQRDELPQLQRERRTLQENEKTEDRDKRWIPDAGRNKEQSNSLLAEYAGMLDGSSDEVLESMLEKKYFSPWGGKRSRPIMEHMWTWKRSNNVREPSMPKRVRFSPWGGKRSGKMVYKPGSKSSKIIFSSSIPELTRIVTNYSPNGKRIDIAGFEFVPVLDKLHPIKILAMATKANGRPVRDAMPFKKFFEKSPKGFKHGHPYFDVNLKKDGKRKVKFSAWGGKRSPPIIGPIWTPANQNSDDDTVKAVFLLRNSKDQEINEQLASS